jgi:hypothetical protein
VPSRELVPPEPTHGPAIWCLRTLATIVAVQILATKADALRPRVEIHDRQPVDIELLRRHLPDGLHRNNNCNFVLSGRNLGRRNAAYAVIGIDADASADIEHNNSMWARGVYHQARYIRSASYRCQQTPLGRWFIADRRTLAAA